MFRKACALVVVLALLMGASTALAASPQTGSANAAVNYIKTLQNSDGGFPAFGAGSTPGSTLDAVFAFVAHGDDPTTVTNAGNGPDDYLATQAASYSADPGAAAKLALGVAAMDLDITNFGGQNLLAIMNANYNSGTGSYGLDLFDEVFYISALKEAGLSVPAGAAPYVISQQQPGGGWEFASGFGVDSNTTAFVIQALLAAGISPNHASIVAALGYLHSTQNNDGGFGYDAAGDSDPNSTAVVIQALVAAKQVIDDFSPWVPRGVAPWQALVSFRNPATGAFQYFGFDSAFATYQAVPALMLAPFPYLQTVAAVGGVAELREGFAASASASAAGRDSEMAWWLLGALGVVGVGATGVAIARRRAA